MEPTTTRPFTQAHALAAVEFAVVREGNATREEMAAAVSFLRPILEQEGLKSEIADDDGSLQVFSEDSSGEKIEVIDVSAGLMVLRLFDYRGWDHSLRRASEVFEGYFAWLDMNAVAVDSFGVQFVDKFIRDAGPAGYTVRDVFNTSSRYFSGQVEDTGAIWKAQVMWFEDIEESQTLNVLQTGTTLGQVESEGVPPHVTEVAHRQQAHPSTSQSADAIKGLLSSCFDEMHARNKKMLGSLLSKDMQVRIGLTEF